MTFEEDLVAALAALVQPQKVAGRSSVQPDVFAQETSWPAIRYAFITAIPTETSCGSGGDAETDFTVQIDVVASTAAERNAVRAAVQQAMQAFTVPNVCESWALEFEPPPVKAYRARMDFVFSPASEQVDAGYWRFVAPTA